MLSIYLCLGRATNCCVPARRSIDVRALQTCSNRFYCGRLQILQQCCSTPPLRGRRFRVKGCKPCSSRAAARGSSPHWSHRLSKFLKFWPLHVQAKAKMWLREPLKASFRVCCTVTPRPQELVLVQLPWQAMGLDALLRHGEPWSTVTCCWSILVTRAGGVANAAHEELPYLLRCMQCWGPRPCLLGPRFASSQQLVAADGPALLGSAGSDGMNS